MKPFGFHEGDRSEFLAQFAFSTIGYCVPVPRQFDRFGVDVIVHLFERVGANVAATGRAVALQVKSDANEILIDTKEMRDCLYATSLPFFLAVIDKAEWRLDVYTTFLRLLAYWSNPDATVRLVPGDKDARAFPEDGSTIVFLGKPIASVLLADLEAGATKVETRERLSRVVNHWARWEQRHLDWRDDGVPFVACPGQYETGVPFSTAYGDIDFLTVPDPGRLPAANNNFARVLTAVHGYYEQLLEHAHGLGDDARARLTERNHIIEALLGHFLAHGTG